MRWGSGRRTPEELRFTTRGEAFAFLLKERLEKGDDALEAAEKANHFAELFAQNMGLPEKAEPPVKGLDKYLQTVDKVVCYCDQHPKAVDMLTGVATFLVGALAGKTAEQATEPPAPPAPPIDFDKLE
jgi:proline dehydrogenase